MRIVTDSAANLTAQERDDWDVTVAPLTIQFPEEEIQSSAITPDDFYQRLKAMKPEIPTTALPSAGYFEELFRNLSKDGEEILAIHISSGLSGTLDSARLGAEGAGEADVVTFDSKTLSGGQRFQVLAASLADRAGWGRARILERLRDIRENTEVIYSLETLEYLERGGRIGRVQSLVSSLLNIKPVIHVDRSDGKYSTVGKARTLPRTLSLMAAHLEELFGSRSLWATVLHGQLDAQAQELRSLLEDRLSLARAEIMRVTPVLGVHTGPGIVGAALVPMDLLSDLLP